MQVIICIAKILTLIGGLNWGFVGFFGLDLVSLATGSYVLIAQLIYCLVGLSALLVLIMLLRGDCMCGPSCACKNKSETQNGAS